MPCTVTALVLAAGHSRRFGSDKRQHLLSSGQTLLQASLQLPCVQLGEVWLALRDDDPAPVGLADNVRILQSSSSRLGLGHSIATSVAQISTASNAQGLLVMLGDMPFIQPATLAALLAKADRRLIIRPTYQGKPGHPVLFGREWWPQLCTLTGDEGAPACCWAIRRRCAILNWAILECCWISTGRVMCPAGINTRQRLPAPAAPPAA